MNTKGNQEPQIEEGDTIKWPKEERKKTNNDI
jgi:hypothetical protein